MCNFNNSKVTCSIQLLDKQFLLCNHMPVSYSNIIPRLLGILSSHQQHDCPCCHCACLCHQRKSTTPNNKITNSTSETATTKINKIVKLHEELSGRVDQGGKDTAEQVNKKRLKRPTFEREDKVYLLTKNLKSKQPSSKLDHVRIGPFKVEKQTSKVNYQLKLPAKAQIHPNFHVSLLKPAPKNAPVQTEWNIEEEKKYNIKKILDSRKINGKNQYLIK